MVVLQKKTKTINIKHHQNNVFIIKKETWNLVLIAKVGDAK